ncbi:type I-B CRISPR-associated protein Cas7/Cst2/DevR [Natranaerobius trueperi]|uniref:Type I-B CRISPR-associated protein Cas7/Cst2/DevR n=1 Tax=Natranaerobius trueperi TaxID=759412 RepID=A0A226BXI2_9FIRM|nr:type I-B CRISPR-associated protein Cas7/Cst2/DevR [Natranaerobius trueperi]OWZ83738.1 type I-B CRISPR-associated protein Cas7/Cst2/DevR [Natranaerobius trueperi]
MKSLSLIWLSKSDLSNLNSGEGGGNLTELKLYDNKTKPYVSGQSMRRALFDTVAREYEDVFKCTPELPCTDIENCWGCDLRGFLATEENVGGSKRWSPLKVSPALGQLKKELVTDLLTRHSDIEKEGMKSKDQRMAYVQMVDNLYKMSLVIDTANIGRVVEPEITGNKSDKKFAGWNETVNISGDDKKERVNATLDAVFNLSGFAKQARSMSDLSPDILFLSIKETYNQRGQQIFDLDENGKLNIDKVETILKEHQLLGNEIILGLTPGILDEDNEKELTDLFDSYGVQVVSVLEAINWAKEKVSKAEL